MKTKNAFVVCRFFFFFKSLGMNIIIVLPHVGLPSEGIVIGCMIFNMVHVKIMS